MSPQKPSRIELAEMIDHAALSPQATIEDVRSACQLAAQYKIACICVRPSDVALAKSILGKTDVAVGGVIGFPHGSSTTEIKAAETRKAIEDGADELDMVINIGRLVSGEIDFVRDDIKAVVDAAGGRIVKVIFECCYLNRDQMAAACKASEEAGASYVKTSTGTAASGATLEDVSFMRQQVGDRLGVKASGGIHTLEDALAMIDAGATRIGTSSTKQILDALD